MKQVANNGGSKGNNAVEGGARVRGYAFIHSAVFLFGFAGLFGKLVSVNPVVMVLFRVCVSCIVLAAVARVLHLDFRLRKRKHWALVALLGALLAVHWITFFQSIKDSTVAIGVLTYSTFPVFVIFIEPVFLGERPSRGDVIAAVVSFIGIFLIVPTFSLSASSTRGVIWGVISGFAFALLSVLNRKYVRRYSSIVLALYQDFFVMIYLLPVVLFMSFAFKGWDIPLLLLLGVVFTAGSHTLFIQGLRWVEARTAGIISMLEPLYGIIFAMVLLGEMPPARTYLGGALILGAAAWATARSGKERENKNKGLVEKENPSN